MSSCPFSDCKAGDDFTKSICSTLADIMKAEFTIPDLIMKNFAANAAKASGPETRVSRQSGVAEVNYDKDQLAARYKEKLTIHTTIQQTESELMKARIPTLYCFLVSF